MTSDVLNNKTFFIKVKSKKILSSERFFVNFKPHHHVPKLSIILLQALKEPLTLYFIVIGNGIMFFSAYIFFIFEYQFNPQIKTYWDALWWALCTVSTVGYGDLYPITLIGRLTGAFLIITGVMCFLGSLAVLVSIMTTALARSEKKNKNTNE